MGFLSRLDPVARAVAAARRDLRARAGLERRTLGLPDGREVVYLDNGDLDSGAPGDTRPVLLALHGIGASKDHWPRLAAELAGRVRVVAPDLPGFGESDRDPDGDYSMTAQAEAVVAFADACGLGRVHLAGSSMGGRIAAEVAHDHPERLRSLWLLAPAGAQGERLSEMIEGVLAGTPVPLFSQTASEYAAMLDYVMVRPPRVPRPALRVLAAESAQAYALNHVVFQAMSAELAARPSTEALLAGLGLPTLITWGQDDRVLDASGAATIAAAMPRATVEVMADTGHLPMLEDPGATAAAFLAFLDAHAF